MAALEWPRLQALRYSQQGRSQRVFSLAFPTLFPRGLADWALPRVRSKSLKFFDWGQHLLRFHDGRFARHSRFRYSVHNIWLRDLSSARSRWVVNRHQGNRVTIDELRQNLSTADDPNSILNSVVRCASSIKGTRPYWKRRSRELSAHIQWLGKPAFFFTFSAADTQWDSLQRFMPEYSQWKEAEDEERPVILSQLLFHTLGMKSTTYTPSDIVSTAAIFAVILTLLRGISTSAFAPFSIWFSSQSLALPISGSAMNFKAVEAPTFMDLPGWTLMSSPS